ncbi:hypothetical protein Pelo_804 [Pelomyxa schiedti]|nr:hypothetical protein Pelo_804 [Pelomyxa schiedti]
MKATIQAVIDARSHQVNVPQSRVVRVVRPRLGRRLLQATTEKLVVWRVNRGVPVCHGFDVTRTVPLNESGAKFSPFDPCGDELAFVGGSQSAVISFVNLERSIDAGVTVKARECLSLPHPNPFDLIWASPNTIITLHCILSGRIFTVYNTMTGNFRSFPFAKYLNLLTVPPAHVAVQKKGAATSVREILSVINLSQEPSFRYVCKPVLYSCESVYVIAEESSSGQSVTSICDTLTGKILANLFMTKHFPFLEHLRYIHDSLT